jgi:hypothetical protein
MRLWGSNTAVLWTTAKSEEEGIHVHTHTESNELLVDQTFGRVVLDGYAIDALALRYLMAQRSLPYLAPFIRAVNCVRCNAPHFDQDPSKAVQPHMKHTCSSCGSEFVDRIQGECVGNPLVAILDSLRLNRAA